MANISKDAIKAYALENAVKYKGKANQGSVLAGLFAEGLEKSEVKEIMPKIKEVIDEVNSMSVDEQKKELEIMEFKTSKREVREGLPPLPNAEEKKVVMRVAPFPSGPLHIGNARPLVLNDEYAKIYKGKLILVIDDTIGSEEKPIEPLAYDLIKEGADWLGVNYDKKIIYKSDRFETYLAYAEEMLKKGYMYVCDCSAEEMRDLRAKGIECPCRHYLPDQQMERWKKMATAPEGSMTVRLKTNMQDPDPAFRDRVMLRISDRPHARTGTKYRIYPLLDFSWAIDDHLLGITHILRGMELAIESRVENFIFDIFRWSHPEVLYNGHFGIEGVKISKSKGAKEVKSGAYLGWNDPRTWSLQSLRDRGIRPEAVRQFIINLGLNKTSIKIPVEVLYALNRKFLEDVPRYFFVPSPQKIKIGGCPEFTVKLPRHPTKNKGHREYETSQEFFIPGDDYEVMQNGNYRLMHLLNFRSDQVLTIKPREFSFVSKDPDGSLQTKFIQWLPANAKNIDTYVVMPDGTRIKGLGEPELNGLKVGEVVQFERFGFVRLHKKEKDNLEFWFTHF